MQDETKFALAGIGWCACIAGLMIGMIIGTVGMIDSFVMNTLNVGYLIVTLVCFVALIVMLVFSSRVHVVIR